MVGRREPEPLGAGSLFPEVLILRVLKVLRFTYSEEGRPMIGTRGEECQGTEGRLSLNRSGTSIVFSAEEIY